MNARQNGQNGGDAGNGDNGAAQNGQGGQDSLTTTTAAQAYSPTEAAGATASTSISSPSSTSTSASNSSSTVSTAVIGGIVGGLAFLLLISLIGIFLLQRRKKRQLAEKNGTSEPVTYAAYTGHDIGNRGDSPPGRRDSGDYFLPTYAESQAGMSVGGAASMGRLNSTYRANAPSSAHNVSPISMQSQAAFSQHAGSNTIISPISRQTTGTGISVPTPAATGQQYQSFDSYNAHPQQSTGRAIGTPQYMGALAPQHTGQSDGWTDLSVMEEYSMGIASPLPSPMRPQTRDTMGFPETSMIVPTREFSTPVPIISPTPRHPRVHRAEIERALREGTPDIAESAIVAELPTRHHDIVRAGSTAGSEVDSDVLGSLGQGLSVAQHNVMRNVSQRTIDSESSMGIEMVTEAELERLGIGAASLSHR